MLRAVAMLAVLGMLLPGCLATECDTAPFARLPVAVVGVPPAVIGPVAIAACPHLVTYDGHLFTTNVGVRQWQVPSDALTDIGVATGSNFPISGPDRRVFGLDGVPTHLAIAMRLGGGDDVTVLLSVDSTIPPELCPYISAAHRPVSCGDPGDPPGRTNASKAP